MVILRNPNFSSIIPSSLIIPSSFPDRCSKLSVSFPFPPIHHRTLSIRGESRAILGSNPLRSIHPRRLTYIPCAKHKDEDFQPDLMWKVVQIETTFTRITGLTKVVVTLCDPDGRIHTADSVGTPAGAAYNAVSSILKEPATLIEYSLVDITKLGLLDPLVTVRVRFVRTTLGGGEEIQISGVGAGFDIVRASVEAYLQALCL